MGEVLHLSLQMALGIALPIVIIRRDIAGLAQPLVARCWNDASLWAAVVAFGPIAIVVHFARSRRSLGGFFLGLGWALAMLVVLSLVAFAFSPAQG